MENLPNRELFDRVPAEEYIRRLPTPFAEAIRRMGYDTFFIRAPFDRFAHYLCQHIDQTAVERTKDGKNITKLGYNIERNWGYDRIMIIKEGKLTYIVIFQYGASEHAIVLISSETIIEWGGLVEQIYYKWEEAMRIEERLIGGV